MKRDVSYCRYKFYCRTLPFILFIHHSFFESFIKATHRKTSINTNSKSTQLIFLKPIYMITKPTKNFPTLYRWMICFLLFLGIGITNVQAQVSTYTFAQGGTGTYVPLSASRTIVFTATALATADPGLGDDQNYTLASGTIPFSFTFSGTAYTGVNINTNGYITFGATLPTSTDRNGLTNTTAWNASIVAVGRDLSANTATGNLGEVSYEVLGTAPNRIFAIQYSKFRRFSSSSTFTENFTFQIRLNEGGGVASGQTVDIVYGACTSTSTSTTASSQTLVGLRGTTTADFKNRTQTSNWLLSTAGATNTTSISMRHSTTVSPPTGGGLTFTWSPPSGCTGTPAAGAITTSPVSKCAGSTQTIAVTGATTGTGITYQWEVSAISGSGFANVSGGTGATTTSYTTAALVSGTWFYRMKTTCSNGGGINYSPEFVLNVNALPNVTLTPSSGSICIPGGSPISLTATGASTYGWTPITGLTPSAGSPVVAIPSSTTTYTVTGTDANGCINTATATINIGSAPVISGVTATPPNVCNGGSSILQANAYSPNNSYCIPVYTSFDGTDGISKVELFDATGTISLFSRTSGLVALPGYDNQTSLTTTTLTAGTGYKVAMTITASADNVAAYLDYNNNGLFTDANENIMPVTALAGLGTNTVSFTVPAGAYNGKARLRFVELFGSGTSSCNTAGFGETEDYLVSITGGVNDPSLNASWSQLPVSSILSSTTTNPMTASNITVNETYNITVTSAAGCSASGSVNVSTGAALACTNITTSAACDGQNFTLTMNTTGGGGAFNYTWSDGVGGVYANAATITANLVGGTYNFSCNVTDACGGNCTSNLSVLVGTAPGGVASGAATGVTGTPNAYSVTGEAAGSSYQWQTATVSGGPYTNVGTNSATENITFSSVGTKFIRCVITGLNGCTTNTNEVTTIISLAGDDVCNAIPLVLGLNSPYSNVGATVQTGEPAPPATSCTGQLSWCSGQVPSNSVWFSFVAPTSGRVSIAVDPGNWDSQLALYSAENCASLLTTGGATLLAANDDITGSSPFHSKITAICLIPGTTYYLQVDGFSTTTNAAFGLNLVDEGNAAPTFAGCPSNIILNTACDASTAIATWTAPTASDPDNCLTPLTTSSNYNSGDAFPIGTTTVTYSANDGPNTVTCSFDVTVNAFTSTAHTTSETACDTYTWACNGTTYTTSGSWTCTSLNASGCLHTETLSLLINSSSSNTTNVTSCDSYTWLCNGTTYTSAGSWTCTSLNAAGCTHTETLSLSINSSTTSQESATACESYTWACNGMTYTASGSYTCTTLNSAGCTHTTQLDLIINYNTTSTLSETACGSYTWACNGVTYTSGGVYVCTSINAAGCVNTETLDVDILYTSYETESETACNSYTWYYNNVTYTTSGSYTASGTTAAGCIEVVTLNLTINNSTTSSSSATACNSYTWSCNGNVYTTSGTYICTSNNASGCPNIAILNLVINHSTTSTASATACNTYHWNFNNQNYTASGTYSAVGLNASGCPNTRILNLVINYTSTTSLTATACDSYTWSCNGNTYTASGTYTCTSLNSSGCTNTATLNLTIKHSSTSSNTIVACNSYTWSCNGNTYTTSGTYTCTSINVAGCINTATLNLTINNSSTSSSSATACDTYTWSCNGTAYTTSGTYTCTSLNGVGCVNTATLNLTINNSTTSSSSATACDSYTWSCNGTSYTTSGTYTCTSLNGVGCVNTATLNLTINNSSISSSSATACNTYTWSCNGTAYTTSGTYTCTSLNGVGCVNTATLNLTINNSSTSSLSATACDTYTWSCNGTAYTTSGTYTCTSLNGVGCVNTATLNLTINNSTTTSSSATACDSYTWAANGQTYTMGGSYTNITLNSSNCVNTETLTLTINSSTTTSSSATACDSYTWAANGQTYTMGGSYTNTTLNSSNCVNTETLTLTVNYSTTTSSSATACDTYTWSCNGTAYTTSGTYTCTSLNGVGCVNTATLNLTINNSSTSSSSATACDSYTWAANGQTYTTGGSYTNTTLNSSNCVNTETLTLTVNYSSTTSSSATACDSYTWSCNGTTYTAGGNYTCTSMNGVGCVNTATLNLTINNSSTSSSSATSCDSYTWSCNGTTYTVGGTYTCTSMNGVGCVNTATLNLTINSSSTSSSSATACNTYTWSCNGTTYTSGGTYTCTSLNASGCINTATLNLTINNSSTSSSSATACNTYTWSCNGTAYTTSGTYTCTSLNGVGCVNTATLNLTINNSSTSSSSATACNTYTWSCNGTSYTTSGTYTCTSLNGVGCVNTATLNLTINNSSTSNLSATACNTYTWSCNGTAYTTSGTYTCTSLNGVGCVNTATLNLTINNSTSSSSSATACNTYTWSCNGNTYTSSGTYTCTSINAVGCTHTLTLNLIINNTSSSTTTVTACNSYTWSCNNSTYTASGSYICLSINAAGCVHTETLNLTINNSTSQTTSATVCATYTWSCNNVTYTSSGNYTCTSINAAGCVHTSTLNLTVSNPGTTINVSATACNTYTWSCNGNSYTASGTYVCTSANTSGCTISTVLNLTINNSTSNSTPVTSCGSYTWSVTGLTYTASGTYTKTSTNASGCVHTEILNLTIVSSTTSSVTIASCGSYTWSCNGQTYTVSGTYTCSTTATSGCINISILNLTVSNAPVVTGLNVTAIAAVSATVNWTPVAGVGWYEIQYMASNSSTWSSVTAVATLSSKVITGLTPGTSYQVRIRSFCNSAPGAWSTIVIFATTSCAIPSGLVVTNITNTTSKLNWNTANGATYYTVRYKKTSTSTWIFGTSTLTNKAISGLTAGTQYEFQVSSNCGSSLTSAFSASTIWTTPTTLPPTVGRKEISTEEEINSDVNIYPNPTSNVLNIDLTVEEAQITTIKVLDMSGRLIKQVQTKTEKGMNPMTISLGELSSGIYALQIFEDAKLTHVSKIEKK